MAKHQRKLQDQEASNSMTGLQLGAGSVGLDGNELLLHADAAKNNLYQAQGGKPSEEANQINDSMVETYMTFTRECEIKRSNDQPLAAMPNFSSFKEHQYQK